MRFEISKGETHKVSRRCKLAVEDGHCVFYISGVIFHGGNSPVIESRGINDRWRRVQSRPASLTAIKSLFNDLRPEFTFDMGLTFVSLSPTGVIHYLRPVLTFVTGGRHAMAAQSSTFPIPRHSFINYSMKSRSNFPSAILSYQ